MTLKAEHDAIHAAREHCRHTKKPFAQYISTSGQCKRTIPNIDRLTQISFCEHVMQGASTAALPYFICLGFQLPPNENPADFFLDIVSGCVACHANPDFQIEVRCSAQGSFQDGEGLL